MLGGEGHRWGDELVLIPGLAQAEGYEMTSAGLAGLAHLVCNEFPKHHGARCPELAGHSLTPGNGIGYELRGLDTLLMFSKSAALGAAPRAMGSATAAPTDELSDGSAGTATRSKRQDADENMTKATANGRKQEFL